MFIQTESTPNPASMKFLPGRTVLDQGTVDFASAEEADVSPLARQLFEIDGVIRVMYGQDFIAVTKADGEWQHLKPAIMGTIMDHFLSGEPLLKGEGTDSAEPEASDGDDPVARQIIDLLETRVRPAVAQDGGDITFHSFEPSDGVVYLHMRGACAGCPSSTMTLKSGIENLLKHYIPEVSEVRAL